MKSVVASSPIGGAYRRPLRWRQASTVLPDPNVILTAAPAGTAAQLSELQGAINDAHAAWAGVAGSTLEAASYPGQFAPITATPNQNACLTGQQSNADGVNTICFDQASNAFTASVLAFTRTIVPANPFAPATFPPASPGGFVTGIFGTQVVAVDSATGAVVAGVMGGWSCDRSNSIVNFDGSFDLERRPVGRTYLLYVEPFDCLAQPSVLQPAVDDL